MTTPIGKQQEKIPNKRDKRKRIIIEKQKKKNDTTNDNDNITYNRSSTTHSTHH